MFFVGIAKERNNTPSFTSPDSSTIPAGTGCCFGTGFPFLPQEMTRQRIPILRIKVMLFRNNLFLNLLKRCGSQGFSVA